MSGSLCSRSACLVRDTCVYSILDIEWPEAKTSLEARLHG